MTTEIKNDGKSKSFLNSISSKHYVVFLTIFGIGIISLLFSTTYEESSLTHHIFRDIGIALIPIGIIGLAYEIALRKEFIEQMKKEMKINIDDAINNSMPSSLKQLRKSGVVDAYPDLDLYNLKGHLKNCDANTEIKILDIWFEKLDQVGDILFDLIIQKNCKVRILIWDLNSVEVLDRRAHSLGKNKTRAMLMNSIVENLKTIQHIYDKLNSFSDKTKIENLQVKLYSSFIGVSLFGIGYDFYLGFFLQDRVSSDGTLFKISGYDRFFYIEVSKHFEAQWNDKDYTKDFKYGDVTIYETIYNNYIYSLSGNSLKRKTNAQN